MLGRHRRTPAGIAGVCPGFRGAAGAVPRQDLNIIVICEPLRANRRYIAGKHGLCAVWGALYHLVPGSIGNIDSLE
jgi:hypothetical protein